MYNLFYLDGRKFRTMPYATIRDAYDDVRDYVNAATLNCYPDPDNPLAFLVDNQTAFYVRFAVEPTFLLLNADGEVWGDENDEYANFADAFAECVKAIRTDDGETGDIYPVRVSDTPLTYHVVAAGEELRFIIRHK